MLYKKKRRIYDMRVDPHGDKCEREICVSDKKIQFLFETFPRYEPWSGGFSFSMKLNANS